MFSISYNIDTFLFYVYATNESYVSRRAVRALSVERDEIRLILLSGIADGGYGVCNARCDKVNVINLDAIAIANLMSMVCVI